VQIHDLRPGLRMLVDGRGVQAYLLRRGDAMALVDTGSAGHGTALATTDWGPPTHVVLTHWHPDHTGSAAEVRARTGATVLAHRADAPVVRGVTPGAEPVFTPAERPLHAAVAAGLPPAPPCPVDVELDDGDRIDDLGAVVVAVPGHTDGSIALHLPDEGVLFTGDVAAQAEGQVILGPFNTDRVRAAASFRRFADLPADAVCFGHGAPLLGGETALLVAAATATAVPDPLGPPRRTEEPR
jgi:glyoxylase-like metal-dependent hydrolase (beta-lactamase superfamily II)